MRPSLSPPIADSHVVPGHRSRPAAARRRRIDVAQACLLERANGCAQTADDHDALPAPLSCCCNISRVASGNLRPGQWRTVGPEWDIGRQPSGNLIDGVGNGGDRRQGNRAYIVQILTGVQSAVSLSIVFRCSLLQRRRRTVDKPFQTPPAGLSGIPRQPISAVLHSVAGIILRLVWHASNAEAFAAAARTTAQSFEVMISIKRPWRAQAFSLHHLDARYPRCAYGIG